MRISAMAAALVAVVFALSDNAAADLYKADADRFPAKAKRYGPDLTERYLALWERVGSKEAGANLVIEGASEPRIRESADRLAAWLNPPEAVVSETTESVSSAPAYSSSGNYAIPEEIVMCESGGDYGAVNSSSGAYGAYQILPSTSAAYGCDMSTPAGQDACAAEIYADSGGSAWVC